MGFSVILTEKGGDTRQLDFDVDEITIGRVDDNHICLPKGNISKKHTKIVHRDGKIIVLDLKSTNGTYVNGKKLTGPQVITPQDQIYIGDFILNVDPGGGAPLDDLPPEDLAADQAPYEEPPPKQHYDEQPAEEPPPEEALPPEEPPAPAYDEPPPEPEAEPTRASPPPTPMKPNVAKPVSKPAPPAAKPAAAKAAPPAAKTP